MSNVTMIAPSGRGGVVQTPAGSYTIDASGFVSVDASQVPVLLAAGFATVPGDGSLRHNLSATTNPGSSNDSTQDYAIGSLWFNKSTGSLFMATSVTATAAVWATINSAAYPGLAWLTGRFYGLPRGVTPVSFLTVASVLYAYPIFVPNAVTLAALQVSVLTGQTGGKVEAGLYADNGAGYPGALVTGTDTGDLDGTGTAVVGPTNLAVALQPGWYWAAVQAAATSTMPSVAGSTVSYGAELGNLVGFDSAAHLLAAGSEACMAIKKTSLTYAALLATFPAGAAPVLNSGAPLVSLGV